MKPETKTVETLPESERALLQQAFAVAQETGITTVNFAAQRLKAVLTIGHMLNHWRKKVSHSQWYPWLESNVFTMVEVGLRTVTNYMRLAQAETAGKIKIEDGVGVRSALIQAGVIPASDKAASSSTARVKGAPATILAIVRVSHLAGRLDVEALDEHQRATIIAALRPLAVLHGRLVSSQSNASGTK